VSVTEPLFETVLVFVSEFAELELPPSFEPPVVAAPAPPLVIDVLELRPVPFALPLCAVALLTTMLLTV
jgi:hypothetical protein